MSTPQQQTDIVNEYLELPAEFAHLCAAIDDDSAKVVGKMRFLLNSDVLDMYRNNVLPALEISRGLPEETGAGNLSISDPVVLFLLTSDPEVKAVDNDAAPAYARAKAAGWYERKKKQAENDAMFIAMSMYNDLNIVPVPYRDGEVAFSITSEDRSRKLPSWVAETESAVIPEPERHLSNVYERRLKQLYQLTQACGSLWTMQFRSVYERGLTRVLRLAEPRDTDGFPDEQAGGTLPKNTRTKGGK